MIVEEIDDVEPFATVTIEVYEQGDDHIPVMELLFAEDYPIENSHMISVRDSIALLLYKVDMSLERSKNLVILGNEDDELQQG
jgi:hypothetical protein